LKILFTSFLLTILFQDVKEVIVTSYKINGKTATGQLTKSIEEPFVAVSRDLLSIYPLGSYIYLSNCKWEGMYKVLDKMGKRKVNTIDVFSPKSKTGHVNCSCSPVK
jgi:3D (Asp-Asp-Asp) domain-containing protein